MGSASTPSSISGERVRVQISKSSRGQKHVKIGENLKVSLWGSNIEMATYEKEKLFRVYIGFR